MSPLFSADTYRARRAKLKAKLGSGRLVFLGNEQSAMNYKANHYPFRQDSSFLYFFGLDQPGLAAFIDVEADKEIIFGNELTMDDIVWEGPQPSLQELGSRVGISQIESPDKLQNYLGPDTHFLPPYRPENQVKIAELLGQSIGWVEDHASVDMIKAVISIREQKEPQEIEQLHEAVSISAAMHLKAMQIAKPGIRESDVVGELLKVAAGKGSFYSFPPIVTINGQTLHNHDYSNELQEGRLLLCDCGAENHMHYAGDMTRAFPVARAFSSRQREIYQIVLEALKSSAALAKPGMQNLEVHKHAAKVILDGLKSVGLVNGDTAEAVEAGAHALFFPHGLGHMMGLDVHDMEDYGEDHVGYGDELARSTIFGFNALRLAKTLQPGFVLTIEPGIYFIPDLIHQWKAQGKFREFLNYDRIDQYLDFGGIRIENDYHITEGGNELLGTPLPMEVEHVEEVRRAAY